MQWMLQLVLPELLDAARQLGPPSTLEGAGGERASFGPGIAQYQLDAGGSLVPVVGTSGRPRGAALLHRQLARSLALTAVTFGACMGGWLRAASLPAVQLFSLERRGGVEAWFVMMKRAWDDTGGPLFVCLLFVCLFVSWSLLAWFLFCKA
jgi:hypothetical protein